MTKLKGRIKNGYTVAFLDILWIFPTKLHKHLSTQKLFWFWNSAEGIWNLSKLIFLIKKRNWKLFLFEKDKKCVFIFQHTISRVVSSKEVSFEICFAEKELPCVCVVEQGRQRIMTSIQRTLNACRSVDETIHDDWSTHAATTLLERTV